MFYNSLTLSLSYSVRFGKTMIESSAEIKNVKVIPSVNGYMAEITFEVPIGKVNGIKFSGLKKITIEDKY